MSLKITAAGGRPRMRAFSALLAAFAVASVFALTAPRVSAHAEYESSTPARGAVLASAPAEVLITFDSDIAISGLSIEVTDSAGTSVTSGEASRNASNHARAQVAVVSGIDDGRYVVRWTNVSLEDGDDAEGAFSFYVGTEPTEEDLAKDAELEEGHHEEPTVIAPGATPTPHDHGMPEMPGMPTPPPAPLVDGSVAAVLSPLNNSGVGGTAVIRSLDGGARSEVTVVLSGLAPGTSHMTHLHVGAACNDDFRQLGAHLVDLNNVVADATGRGVAVTEVDVGFAAIATGGNKVVSHTGAAPDSDANKAPIACGPVPTYVGAGGGGITAPNTGTGAAAESDLQAIVVALLFGGTALVATGSLIVVRRLARVS